MVQQLVYYKDRHGIQGRFDMLEILDYHQSEKKYYEPQQLTSNAYEEVVVVRYRNAQYDKNLIIFMDFNDFDDIIMDKSLSVPLEGVIATNENQTNEDRHNDGTADCNRDDRQQDIPSTNLRDSSN